MDQREYIKHIEELYASNVDTVRAKSHDYATQDDPFFNFRLCEHFNLCKTEVGILVRLLDKIGRIANLMNWRPAVKDETLRDTIADAINYLATLDAYLANEESLENEIEYWKQELDSSLDHALHHFEPVNSRYAAERGDGEGI